MLLEAFITCPIYLEFTFSKVMCNDKHTHKANVHICCLIYLINFKIFQQNLCKKFSKRLYVMCLLVHMYLYICNNNKGEKTINLRGSEWEDKVGIGRRKENGGNNIIIF